MASLKELKGRINSVKSTQKITKAKQMVAAAKLRKAQASAEAARPYATRLAEVMGSLASRIVVSDNSPRLLAGTGKDQVHLLVVANSDRGLCGAFNANIVKAARLKAESLQAEGKTVESNTRVFSSVTRALVIRRAPRTPCAGLPAPCSLLPSPSSLSTSKILFCHNSPLLSTLHSPLHSPLPSISMSLPLSFLPHSPS